MKILFEDKNLVVCIKPVGVDSEHEFVEQLQQTNDPQ